MSSKDNDVIICRCEEVTKGEIIAAIRKGFDSLDGVKRLTRAGMGLCQGRSCSKSIARIISQELGIPASEIKPPQAQFPVRPVTVGAVVQAERLEEASS